MFSHGTVGRRSKNADSARQEMYRFTCYIMGTNTPFTVSIPGTEDVEELIRCIREKGELNRLDCHIMDLMYWKVHQDSDVLFDVVADFSKVDIDLRPLRGVASRINMNNYSMTMLNNPTQLISGLSGLWTGQPPAEHVHIIVEVPARGGLSTSTGRLNILLPYISVMRSWLMSALPQARTFLGMNYPWCAWWSKTTELH